MEDQLRVARFYDDLGVKEWLRLESDARSRVILHLHRCALDRWIDPGGSVLDVGCGPGRFSAHLQECGATVVAGDISGVQAAMALQQLARSPSGQGRVVQFTATHLPFADASFDHAIGFGAVLSHAGAQADAVLHEMLRVTRAGGLVLVSVLSRWNLYLPYLAESVRKYGIQSVDQALRGVAEMPDSSGFPWRAFSFEELDDMVSRCGGVLVGATASNVLATVEQIPLLEDMQRDPNLWRTFLSWEEHLSRERGNVERGAFIIAAIRIH